MSDTKLADVLMIDDENIVKPRHDWREALGVEHLATWMRYCEYVERCWKDHQRPMNFDEWKEKSVE